MVYVLSIFKKLLESLYILAFLRIYFAVFCHLFGHKYAYFLQFVEAMGMFLCNKYNHYQWIVFPVRFSSILESYTVW